MHDCGGLGPGHWHVQKACMLRRAQYQDGLGGLRHRAARQLIDDKLVRDQTSKGWG